MHGMKKGKKKALWAVGVVLGLVLLAVAGYVLYVVLSWHRLPDHLELEVKSAEETYDVLSVQEEVEPGQEYGILTYNIGFGAYTPSFSFFMDGGKSSVADSEESVIETVEGAAKLAAGYEPDFLLFEEVDLDATRSYHVDQYELLDETFGGYESTFAVNYDSPFLMVPPWEPHGKSLAGIAFYSRYPIEEAERRSLPVSDSFGKFLDLDRCYSVNRIQVSNGKELVIIALHMSAYGNSDEVREGQIAMLAEEMRTEYEKGNYVICGGDFNHDLKAMEEDGQERASWAYPFPRKSLPEGFTFCIDQLEEAEREALHNSARNADMPYEEGVTYTVTLDGFIVSDNIEMTAYENVDTGYLYSDHDPVWMRFVLK